MYTNLNREGRRSRSAAFPRPRDEADGRKPVIAAKSTKNAKRYKTTTEDLRDRGHNLDDTIFVFVASVAFL
jgi:hypothetical protein